MKPVSLIVYDFDGTLVDTLLDIALSLNLVLKDLGLRRLEPDVIRDFVGRGVVNLVTRALEGTDYTDVDQGVELFRKHYANHLVEHTDFYPNSRETVAYFSGKTNAILSNKPEAFIRDILEQLNFLHPFHTILGGDSLARKKPDPQGLLQLMTDTGLSPDQVLMVGDSDVDIETGKRAGVLTCGVTYGLGDAAALKASRPDWLIADMSELKHLVC